MKYGNDQHIYGCYYRPTVFREYSSELRKRAVFRQSFPGGIAHKDDRNNYLICGKTQYKSKKYDAVKSHQPSKRIKHL